MFIFSTNAGFVLGGKKLLLCLFICNKTFTALLVVLQQVSGEKTDLETTFLQMACVVTRSP